MKILGGQCKGYKWEVPSRLPFRPTTSFAFEGLMNILHHRFLAEGKAVLELFAGTGQFALEMASRGAKSVTAVDKLSVSCKIIHHAASKMKLPVNTVKEDVFLFLKKRTSEKFDVVFADPPFGMKEAEVLPDLVTKGGWLNPGGWLILEHSSKINFINHKFYHEQRKYGHVCFSIFIRCGND